MSALVCTCVVKQLLHRHPGFSPAHHPAQLYWARPPQTELTRHICTNKTEACEKATTIKLLCFPVPNILILPIHILKMKHVDSKPLSSGHTTSLRRSLRVAEASWQQALASKKHAARSSTAQSSRVAQQYKPAKHSSPPRGRTPDYCTEESLLSPLTPPSAYLPSFLGHAPSSELLPPAVTLSHAEPEHLESSSSLPRATRGRKTEKQERNTRPAGGTSIRILVQSSLSEHYILLVAQTRNNITSRQGGTINATSTVNFQVGASTSGAHPTHTAAHLELPLPTRASVALPGV